MNITICSSVEFSLEIIKIKAELESEGHVVNIPFLTQKIMDGKLSLEEFITAKEKGGDISFRESEQVDMIKRYWRLIKNSDAILVLNLKKKGIEGYIGGSTFMEMGFAYGWDKKVFLFNPIPDRSERMHYIDEIIDMKPVILHGKIGNIFYEKR